MGVWGLRPQRVEGRALAFTFLAFLLEPLPKRPVGENRTMATAISPLALPLPVLPPIAGVRLGAAVAGIRYTTGRTDLVMAEMDAGTSVAGVFTTNKCPGAPIDWCREAMKGGKARAVVINAGNANVFTGKAGVETVKASAAAAAKLVGCPAKQVFLSSTGVIGEVLPHARLTAALPKLHESLSPEGWEAAALVPIRWPW